MWGIHVSEGGLEHPFEWYITETVIHHQPKLTQPRACRAGMSSARGGGSASQLRSERLTCENDEGGGPGRRPMQSRTAVAASRGSILRKARRQPPATAGSSRTARNPAPMTLPSS